MLTLITIIRLKEEGSHAINVVHIIYGKPALGRLIVICVYITASNVKLIYIELVDRAFKSVSERYLI